MDRYTIPRYTHLPNKDGSVDSICAECFATVASVRNESELDEHEHVHVCNQLWSHLGSIYRFESNSPIE